MNRPALHQTYEDLCEAARKDVRSITPDELARLRQDAVVVIDIREASEYQDGTLPNALLIPRGSLEKQIEDRIEGYEGAICLYCASGKRSLLAARTLQEMGFTEVFSLEGGFTGWLEGDHEIAAGPGSVAGSPSSSIDPGNWGSIRSNFAIASRRVATLDGVERPLVYLDHAATTHPPDFAMEEVRNFLSLDYANVHRASYQLARRSTLRFEDAYRTCARFVGADLDHHCVVFTSNTTAACEIVAHAVAPRAGAVLVTDLEHHSSDLPHRRRGRVVRVGLDDDQRLDMSALREALKRDRIKLVSVTGAANVTG